MSKKVLYECVNCKQITSNRYSRKKLFCTKDCYMDYRSKQPLSYHALHTWLYRNFEKSGICQHCNADNKRSEWANISKQYKKDIKDFIELCKPCHERYDEKRHDLFRGRKHTQESKSRIAESVRRNRWAKI